MKAIFAEKYALKIIAFAKDMPRKSPLIKNILNELDACSIDEPTKKTCTYITTY